MNTRVDLSCFPRNYQVARQQLLDGLSKIPAEYLQQQLAFRHPLTGPDDEELYLDFFRLGQVALPKQILVLMSGTHGVEAFAGSAIQRHILSRLVKLLEQHQQLGLIIIHALNPWGFAWLRRYDHQGIDLNRNFVDFDLPLPENPTYDQIHLDLFPSTSTVQMDALAHWRSQLGAQEFESIITRGQYSHHDGLFFGGFAASWSRQILEQVCNDKALQLADRIAVIDLHTGLGPFGHGEIINDHQPGSSGFEWAVRWYGQRARSALLGESCSAPKDGLLDYFWHDLMGKRGCFVTLEYGTHSLDELIKVSYAEQQYHNSYGQQLQLRNIEDPAVVKFRDFFYPQDKHWQEKVLTQAQEIIALAVRGVVT